MTHYCDYGTCTEEATTKIDKCWYCTRHASLMEPQPVWKWKGWTRQSEREEATGKHHRQDGTK